MEGYSIPVRNAQLEAKRARFQALLGNYGYHRQLWTDASRYEGKWKDKQFDGYGVFTWPSGQRYEGGWRKGKQHGYGVLVAADGSETAGKWKNGDRVADTA